MHSRSRRDSLVRGLEFSLQAALRPSRLEPELRTGWVPTKIHIHRRSSAAVNFLAPSFCARLRVCPQLRAAAQATRYD